MEESIAREDIKRFKMEEFIACENIKRFKKALAESPDAIKKATLRHLLADEDAHLKELEAHHPI